MLKIRRPLGRLIFNMGIAIPGKTVFLIEKAPWPSATMIMITWDKEGFTTHPSPASTSTTKSTSMRPLGSLSQNTHPMLLFLVTWSIQLQIQSLSHIIHFQSLLNNEMVLVLEILPHGRICLSCVVSTMAADGLAMQGSLASATMVLIQFAQNSIPVTAPEKAIKSFKTNEDIWSAEMCSESYMTKEFIKKLCWWNNILWWLQWVATSQKRSMG